mgnify:CR=1 FL=1
MTYLLSFLFLCLVSVCSAKELKIFLLTDNPKDALKLVSALGLKNVNLGNYHNRKAEHTASVSTVSYTHLTLPTTSRV